MTTEQKGEFAHHGDVVSVELHRAGGYFRDSSIHEGGGWQQPKMGVLIWGGFDNDDTAPHSAKKLNFGPEYEGHSAWVKFFDGDIQAVDGRVGSVRFPHRALTVVRRATDDELTDAISRGW